MIRPKQINKWSKRREELLESKNICYVFKKSVIFGKITIILEKNCKQVNFFLAILKFLIVPLDAQQNFMLMKYNFFSFFLC